MTRFPAALALSCLGLALGAVPAHAVTGTIAITGTEGRDDVTITRVSPDQVTIFPFVTLTAPPRNAGQGVKSTICETVRDPLTTRAIGHRCDRVPQDRLSWQVDLRGGADSLRMSMSGTGYDGYTASGGAGDDTIVVAADEARSLSGGDGDDSLEAPETGAGQGALLAGGAGRDLVSYASSNNPAVGEPGGVTANLATGRADLLISRLAGRPDVIRTDQLTGIERLTGTPYGDILTGGTGADELLGQDGPDDLTGGDGDDALAGGNGGDRLIGGAGADSIDGGPGIDDFPKGTGGDTFLTRDGLIERISCTARDVVVDDLVDAVADPGNCLSISTAQAKHRFDTVVARQLSLGPRRTAVARVSCPSRKTEACVGALTLRLRGARGPLLARGRYRVAAGRVARVRMGLSRGETRRARGRRVALAASEVDSDGRARRVTAVMRLRR